MAGGAGGLATYMPLLLLGGGSTAAIAIAILLAQEYGFLNFGESNDTTNVSTNTTVERETNIFDVAAAEVSLNGQMSPDTAQAVLNYQNAAAAEAQARADNATALAAIEQQEAENAAKELENQAQAEWNNERHVNEGIGGIAGGAAGAVVGAGAGILTGAALGATAGSVLPGIGTVIGAVVGAGYGLAVGNSTDENGNVDWWPFW